MAHLLTDICCACIPLESLPQLSALRTSRDLRVQITNQRAWLRWPAGLGEILDAVLPIQGVQLFAYRDGNWYRPGQHLPVFDVPKEGETATLLHVLSPAPVATSRQPPRRRPPLSLRLVRDAQPRQTTALRCDVPALLKWAESATTRQLASVSIAVCAEHALLRGDRLPLLAGSTRYWGGDVLLPLGFRWEPQLPESAMRAVIGLQTNEIALVHNEELEVICSDTLQPATRAGIRRQSGLHAQ
jgi:hypothetical protein